MSVIARGITGADCGQGSSCVLGWSGSAQQEQLQNLFSGGAAKRRSQERSTLNYGKMSEALARIGGAPQIQNILGLENLRTQQGLPPIPLTSSPPESMPQQPPRVPSIQRTGGLPVETA